VRPYIYSEVEIVAIVEAAATLRSIYGMRGLTCSTLFGLIAATGLRISEALGLDTADVDLEDGILRVRQASLARSGCCPSPTALSHVCATMPASATVLLGLTSVPFFVNCSGVRVSDCSAHHNFALVSQRIGLRDPQRHYRCGRGPRIHDLRHSFDIITIINWYRTGKDPTREMIKLTTYLEHVSPESHVLVYRGGAGTAGISIGAGHGRRRRGGAAMTATTFPALLQRFFTDRLCTQMEASQHTIAGDRDTFRLLIRFASARCGKPPTKLGIEDLDADLMGDFLVHVETTRGNGARSRNTRLAAIRSFFCYVAMSDPTWLLHCQRILAMPGKRYVKRTVTFLNASEIAALLAAPDQSTWAGRRDHTVLLVALHTGLRASELVNLCCGDVVLGTGATVLHGPGPGCGRTGGDTHWQAHSPPWNCSAVPFKYHG
jgi:integrase